MKDQLRILLAAFRTYVRNIKGRKFEPEIPFLKYMLNENSTCFHIGASDARHSYVMSKIIKGGQIYAFEPSSFSYRHLVMMVRLHRLKNVKTYHQAVSDKKGTVCLVTPEKSTGHAGRSFAFITGVDESKAKRTDIKSEKMVRENVDAVTIDEFVNEQGITSVDFIRCDTEGSERLILKGAAATIEKYLPDMLIEIHSDALKNVFGSSSSEVTDYLFGIGYKMFREDEGKINMVSKVDETEIWKDYFFIHPSRIEHLPEGPFKRVLN